MKVLHFSTEKYWRGGEQQIAYLIDGLDKAGIDNFLVCRRNSEMHKYAKTKGIAYQAISIRNSIDVFAIYQLARILQNYSADFVHLHTSKAHSIALFALPFIKKQSFILHRRVSFTIKKTSINRWKYNHKAIQKIICISEDVKKQVNTIVEDSSKLEVIYSGIDIEKFGINLNSNVLRNELKIPSDHLIVTGVGALSPEKDFITFLKVAQRILIDFKMVHFLIVGKGQEEATLIQLAKDLGIENNICFTGFRKDIPAILKSSDVFMLCSTSEGLGTSFIDAAAAGCPLIGTSVGGIPEIIEDGVNGFLAHQGNVNGITKNLLKLLEDKSLREEMAEKALVSSHKFSIEAMLKKYIEVYNKLLKDA